MLIVPPSGMTPSRCTPYVLKCSAISDIATGLYDSISSSFTESESFADAFFFAGITRSTSTGVKTMSTGVTSPEEAVFAETPVVADAIGGCGKKIEDAAADEVEVADACETAGCEAEEGATFWADDEVPKEGVELQVPIMCYAKDKEKTKKDYPGNMKWLNLTLK